jgi:hypothetical protein
MKKIVASVVAASFLVASAAQADDCSHPKTLADLKPLIEGLGYDVASEGGLLKITINSNYNYPVYFSVSPDKTNLTVFTVLDDLPADKVAAIPTVAILSFNDTHFDYISLNRRSGDLRFIMQSAVPPSAATPFTLRAMISHLIDDANASDALWNPTKWK